MAIRLCLKVSIRNFISHRTEIRYWWDQVVMLEVRLWGFRAIFLLTAAKWPPNHKFVTVDVCRVTDLDRVKEGIYPARIESTRHAVGFCRISRLLGPAQSHSGSVDFNRLKTSLGDGDSASLGV